MSRPLRIEYPGAWYHVMNRGRRSEPIFSDKHDYLMFINLLIEISEMWNVNVAAYCLIKHRNPGPLGQVRENWLCHKIVII